MRKSVSVCMIVKDEESVLERCLNSVKPFADEIIIVDTGSTDATKEIAARFTDKIYDYEWRDDFADARNFSFSKATKDYIMWLDADDVITKENAEKIKFLLVGLKADAVMCVYDISFDESDNPTYSYYRERLLRRKAGFVWNGFVHEVITPAGKVIRSDIAVQHRKINVGSGGRNLKIYEKHIKNGYILNARERFYYSRELFYNENFRKAAENFLLFIETETGYIPNIIDAHIFLYKCCEKLGEKGKGVIYLLSALKYTVPTAEICGEIASWFSENGDFEKALFWYKQALKLVPDLSCGAFINRDYYGLIPCLGLCYCYSRLGDRDLAELYNNMAGEINPNDSRYLHNRKFFSRKQ